MPQWDYPWEFPYSIYQCERPHDQAQGLIPCRLYEPLRSPDHIRLLKIYPPGWPDRLAEKLTRVEDDRIQCDVFQVPLASVTTPKRPYFATLSYVWGDHGVTRQIRCRKKWVSITLSLYEALVHIRNAGTPRLLWIDTLCINQADKREKGRQVRRMHLIYGQSHCISWMGMESKSRDDLQSMLPIFRWFGEIEAHFHEKGKRITWNEVDDHIQHKPACGVSSILEVPWATILNHLDLDIFKRLWCVQELLLARSNDIRTSKSHIDISILARSTSLICDLLADVTSPDWGQISDAPTMRWCDKIRLHTFSSRINSMLMTKPLPGVEFKKKPDSITPTTAMLTIDEYYGRECSDPRDHIYGLAALCNLGTSYQMSYSTSSFAVQKVFIDFTLHCLRTTRSLEAFQFTNRSTVIREDSTTDLEPMVKHRAWTTKLPSWCPDFSGPRPQMRYISTYLRGRTFALMASQDRPAQFKISSRHRLGVIGVQIGTVQNCSNRLYDWRAKHAYSEASISTWQHMASFQRCISSLGSSLPAQSLCRLLLDALSLGTDWQECAAWTDVASAFPMEPNDRVIRSSIGAAWIVHNLPDLASKANLTLHRWHSPRKWGEIADDADRWLYRINEGTRLFTTDNANALIGTGPDGLRAGDIVSVLFGGNVPFILRPDTQGHYTLIGECYVTGVMQGEALDMGLEEREFLLV